MFFVLYVYVCLNNVFRCICEEKNIYLLDNIYLLGMYGINLCIIYIYKVIFKICLNKMIDLFIGILIVIWNIYMLESWIVL